MAKEALSEFTFHLELFLLSATPLWPFIIYTHSSSFRLPATDSIHNFGWNFAKVQINTRKYLIRLTSLCLHLRDTLGRLLLATIFIQGILAYPSATSVHPPTSHNHHHPRPILNQKQNRDCSNFKMKERSNHSTFAYLLFHRTSL